MKALLLINDAITAEVITLYLQRERFDTLTVEDSQEVPKALLGWSPDLIMLDMSFPTADVLALCKVIRRQTDTPMIILSGSFEENEIIHGLELGADDYIVKPFSPRLMVARIKALLRRTGALKAGADLLEVGDLVLECSHRRIWHESVLVARLTHQECRLLEILARNYEYMLPTKMLITHVWGPSRGDSLMLKKLVSRLRRKLAANPDPRVRIETSRGNGYKLVTS